jgi:DNA-binding NarL/FixJ family response regulator
MNPQDRQVGESPAPIRVAVADDHPLYRDGLRTMLQSLPGMEFVGEAPDGVSAVELVRLLQPDVLLLDLQMPGGGGLEALRSIVAMKAATAVLVVTMHEDDGSVVAAISAGARGYVSKGADRNELERAVVACAGGGVVFGAHLASRLAGMLTGPRDLAARAFPSLTPRERDVLDRLARGESNEAIATALGLSSKTVRNQVSVILSKLAVTDRTAAMLLAREAGLGQDDRTRG